jgi:hypothetical protein
MSFIETPEQEAARINAASGDPEGITADQVARNRQLNSSLTSAFGFNNTTTTGGGVTVRRAGDLGQDNDTKKPDGTNASETPVQSTLPEGSAERVTDLKDESAEDKIENEQSSIKEGESNSTSSRPPGTQIKIVPNPLLNFASYSPLWTMACLTKEQFNNPLLYRNNDSALSGIIFSSGGRYDSQRSRTSSGAPEFFVNNFKMISVISPSPKTGNQNAIKFEFDIIEPYSMGLLLQSMQSAAISNKYVSYLDNTPYVLKLEFKGYDETMTPIRIVKPKYFVMKLTKVKFSVNEQGSLYKVEAVPFNHQVLSDVFNVSYTDLSLTGNTVAEVCNKLMEVLNKNEKTLKDEGKLDHPDEYVIEFPEDAQVSSVFNKPVSEPTSATTDPGEVPGVTVVTSKPASSETLDYDPNDIGASDFGFAKSAAGNYNFASESKVIDPISGKVFKDRIKIDPKQRQFLFPQSQKLTDIITQTVLNSRYAKDVSNPKRIDEAGLVRWFKLDVQMQFLEFDAKIGDFAKKIIYRVIPYKVHSSIFANPNSAPPTKNLEKIITKKYDYIYTGQNSDVLNFNIEINNLFYSGINPNSESQNVYRNNPDARPAEQDSEKTEVGEGPAQKAQTSQFGRRRVFKDPSALKAESSGNPDKDVPQKVAEAFHRAFIQGTSADLINVDLEIIGDTYWLVDTGMANYFSPTQPGSELITEDGSANYENSDVFIFITFKTPADVDTIGLYRWPGDGKVSPFSGIYRVTRCENIFENGMFKQRLRCIRLPLQSFDFGGETVPVDKTNTFAIKIGEKKPSQTSLTQNTSLPTIDTETNIPVPPVPAELPTISTPLSINPFDRFINRLGDPNAPPYTGDDPIVRARLGLPPVEVNQGTGAFGEDVSPGDLPQ